MPKPQRIKFGEMNQLPSPLWELFWPNWVFNENPTCLGCFGRKLVANLGKANSQGERRSPIGKPKGHWLAIGPDQPNAEIKSAHCLKLPNWDF